jgi:hypothetical protein
MLISTPLAEMRYLVGFERLGAVAFPRSFRARSSFKMLSTETAIADSASFAATPGNGQDESLSSLCNVSNCDLRLVNCNNNRVFWQRRCTALQYGKTCTYVIVEALVVECVGARLQLRQVQLCPLLHIRNPFVDCVVIVADESYGAARPSKTNDRSRTLLRGSPP